MVVHKSTERKNNFPNILPFLMTYRSVNTASLLSQQMIAPLFAVRYTFSSAQVPLHPPKKVCYLSHSVRRIKEGQAIWTTFHIDAVFALQIYFSHDTFVSTSHLLAQVRCQENGVRREYTWLPQFWLDWTSLYSGRREGGRCIYNTFMRNSATKFQVIFKILRPSVLPLTCLSQGF